MERLSTQKKLMVVRGYLSGLSFDEISAKCSISKGAVSNIVKELKSGKFPEAVGVSEHIEQLRELSSELKRSGLTPIQCAAGLIALTRIEEYGLDPADIDRWSLIIKSAGNEDEAQKFVRLVYSIQEVQESTGLSLDALDNKVHELEKKAVELEPVAEKLADYKKQVADLIRQRKELLNEVANLEEKCKILIPQVKDLDKQERVLLDQVAEMEPRAKKAESTITILRSETQKLQDIGFNFEEIGDLSRKLQTIAQRHAIKPDELRSRLLHELATLDKGLGLETMIKNKKLELKEAEQGVAGTKKEMETARAVVNSLKQEKEKLEASIKETRELVSQEIARLIPIARNTVAQLSKELQNWVDNALASASQLREQSLETGKEVGRYQEILEGNSWLKELLALVQGEHGIEAKRVRVIALLVARSVRNWLNVQDKSSNTIISLSAATDSLMRELEQWKV